MRGQPWNARRLSKDLIAVAVGWETRIYEADVSRPFRTVTGLFAAALLPDANGHERIVVDAGGALRRVDVRTGDWTRIPLDWPDGALRWWFIDREGVPRVATTWSTAFCKDADQKQFDGVSPLKNAARIEVPLLVVHGGFDERVPVTHAERLVEALRATGKQFEWIRLRTEGHGIARPDNRELFYNALSKFLDRHTALPPGAAATVPVAAAASTATR